MRGSSSETSMPTDLILERVSSDTGDLQGSTGVVAQPCCRKNSERIRTLVMARGGMEGDQLFGLNCWFLERVLRNSGTMCNFQLR